MQEHLSGLKAVENDVKAEYQEIIGCIYLESHLRISGDSLLHIRGKFIIKFSYFNNASSIRNR